MKLPVIVTLFTGGRRLGCGLDLIGGSGLRIEILPPRLWKLKLMHYPEARDLACITTVRVNCITTIFPSPSQEFPPSNHLGTCATPFLPPTTTEHLPRKAMLMPPRSRP